MSSEVDKLYSLAGVETNKYKLCCTGCEHVAKLEVINGYPSKWICDKYDEVADCDKAEPDYPLFTAEKQIELIKLFAVWEISIKRILGVWYISVDGLKKNIKLKGDFSEAIAKYINFNWQDLTDAERTQIKEILE